ncbi:hypothetical protein P280DRAFT_466024 [Massarina eburnea CBS 473.64]|uniref:Uncharacterized protein n=1 Tax=Massarina eburnea CBS 473.64 TaxID=1395130 RepID=A0A6A6SEA7_9PLEO|nr:hypothetical protein P280DRAFT_466024 [Massarina eburnea CBS 473.64]
MAAASVARRHGRSVVDDGVGTCCCVVRHNSLTMCGLAAMGPPALQLPQSNVVRDRFTTPAAQRPPLTKLLFRSIRESHAGSVCCCCCFELDSASTIMVINHYRVDPLLEY